MTAAAREYGLAVSNHLLGILSGARGPPQPPNMRAQQLKRAGGRRRGTGGSRCRGTMVFMVLAC